MKLAFTPMARRDLQEIGDYIARDSRRQAMRFVLEIEHFCATLTAQPERYPLSPRHARRGIRRAPFQSYLIFFRTREATVEILHVLHSARDTDTIVDGV